MARLIRFSDLLRVLEDCSISAYVSRLRRSFSENLSGYDALCSWEISSTRDLLGGSDIDEDDAD